MYHIDEFKDESLIRGGKLVKDLAKTLDYLIENNRLGVIINPLEPSKLSSETIIGFSLKGIKNNSLFPSNSTLVNSLASGIYSIPDAYVTLLCRNKKGKTFKRRVTHYQLIDKNTYFKNKLKGL